MPMPNAAKTPLRAPSAAEVRSTMAASRPDAMVRTNAKPAKVSSNVDRSCAFQCGRRPTAAPTPAFFAEQSRLRRARAFYIPAFAASWAFRKLSITAA
jgi:hypothetical protein